MFSTFYICCWVVAAAIALVLAMLPLLVTLLLPEVTPLMAEHPR